MLMKKFTYSDRNGELGEQDAEHAGGGGSIGSSYDLTRERPQEYSSGIFGNLRYEDLKKAHTETVIPVTEELAIADEVNTPLVVILFAADLAIAPILC
jgi:hypothetical protein